MSWNEQLRDMGLTVMELSELLNDIPLEAFQALGTLRSQYKSEYDNKLNYLLYTNTNNKLNGVDDKQDKVIKGKALEDLVKFLFMATGGFFDVYNNIRNDVNEIDLFVCLNTKGSNLHSLSSRYSDLLCECKNYKQKVGVTFIGKFLSLMQQSNKNTGVFFTCNGLTGAGWSDAQGLIKKAFLLKERKEDKYIIIDFSYDDFKRISNGMSLFDLFNEKIRSLELGTNISKFITKHPCEKYITSDIT